MLKPIVLAAFITVTLSSAAQQPRPVLVELFTSEGCSSCPPADELLRKLQGRHTDSGQFIVALSEHVTYWNRLGWSDPFSKEDFTVRQNIYGERFHLDSVYTPQVVVNGNRQVLGSDEDAILNAVKLQSFTAPEMLSIASITPTNGGLAVTFTAFGPVPANTEVFAVVADDMDSSQVARGENAGRTLSHVAVARSLLQVAKLKSAGTTTVAVPLVGNTHRPQHVVLYAQESGQGTILSVASQSVPTHFADAASLSSPTSTP